jgi:hypothetical protein
MLCHVALVITDVSEEHIVSIFRVYFSSLIVFTLKMEAAYSSQMSVPTRTTRRHIQEDSFHFLILFILCHEGGNIFLRNVGSLPTDYT